MLERGGRGVDPARVVTAVEQPARGRPSPAADVEDALRLAQLVSQQHFDQTLSPAEPEVRLLQRGQLLGSLGGETRASTGAIPVDLRVPSHTPTLTRCPDPTPIAVSGSPVPLVEPLNQAARVRSRRGARAVESGGLENRWACKRLLGSNPSPAAFP